jgi:hypothetical protein
MKPLSIALDARRIRITYEHDHQEKADGTLPRTATKERDRAVAKLLRGWAEALESGRYEAVGFASDARTVRRDEMEMQEG